MEKPRAAPAGKGSMSSKVAQVKEPIDVNRASAAELQRLPGIGPKTSQGIIDERNKKPFKSVDDLRRVRGIGPKTLEKLKPYVTVVSKKTVVQAD
jgi:competence protein ComEA